VIERYTLPEMGEIWTDAYKFQTWLQVEIAVCEAQAELGHIPQAAVDEIKAKAKFDVARILEIEAEVRHDVIAFLTNVNEYVGAAGRYIHLGMTSSDVLDTALALQMVASTDVLLTRLEETIQAIRYQAQKHRNTVMIGRSHGIHAEPITFGFKLAGWLAEMLRNRDREDFRCCRYLCKHRTTGRSDRLSEARIDSRHCFYPSNLSRYPCGIRAGFSLDWRKYGAFRRRNPQPSKNRCLRSRRILLQRTKRLLRHAPQTKSDPFRTLNRNGANLAWERDCRPRKRRALARTRHFS
jgi:Lyase